MRPSAITAAGVFIAEPCLKKALFLSTSTNDTHKIIRSFEYLNWAETHTIRYDRTGRDMGGELRNEVRSYNPDVIFYISAWAGEFVPTPRMMTLLNDQFPLIHICCDASDPPWFDQMKHFHEINAFRVQVNIDGCPDWPMAEHGLTTLTPLDPRPFETFDIPLLERPIKCGFAGNLGSQHRAELANYLVDRQLLTVRLRDNHDRSYDDFCSFLKHCQIQLSMCLSGSTASKQVKGRVVEAAYAGCAVLDGAGAANKHWFIPGEDYLEYTSKEDAVEQVKYLIDNPSVLEKLATNLRNKVLAEHSPGAIWGKILDKAGVNLKAEAA